MSPAVSSRKIAEIRMRVARIRELLPAEVDTFLRERTAAEALILNLFLALQECSDLAMHIVAEHGFGVPGDSRLAFELLVDAAVLEPALAQHMAEAVGLRNRIAHEYTRLDLRKVYEAARDDLDDLLRFAAAMADVNGVESS